MNNEIKEIKFIEYNGIEGYIELMKHDVEPLNNPECKNIELYYNGKDIKAVLDYITNLEQKLNFMIDKNDEKQDKIDKAIEYIKERYDYILKSDFLDHDEQVDKRQITYLLNILQGEDKDE